MVACFHMPPALDNSASSVMNQVHVEKVARMQVSVNGSGRTCRLEVASRLCGGRECVHSFRHLFIVAKRGLSCHSNTSV